MNAAQKRIVRLDDKPLRWVDEEQTMLDTAAMYEERLRGRPTALLNSQAAPNPC